MAGVSAVAVLSLSTQMLSLIHGIRPLLENEKAMTTGLANLKAEVDASSKIIEAVVRDPTFASDISAVPVLRNMDSLRETLQAVYDFAETTTTMKPNLLRMLKNREQISHLSQLLEDQRQMLQLMSSATIKRWSSSRSSLYLRYSG
jgi:hypothetical protein